MANVAKIVANVTDSLVQRDPESLIVADVMAAESNDLKIY